MTNDTDRLFEAVRLGLTAGGNLCAELDKLGEFEIHSLVDAQAVIEAVDKLDQCDPTSEGDDPALAGVLRMFSRVTSKQTFEHLVRRGIPGLVDAYEARLRSRVTCQADLLAALRVLARYGTEPGLECVVNAAFDPALCDGSLWRAIFSPLGKEDPILPKLIRRLSKPLPQGFVCVAFLEWVNRLVREDVIAKHPFDTPQGRERLQAWLTSDQGEDCKAAQGAAAAIPFLSEPDRSRLLALAMDHSSIEVQMEGAWAAARLENPEGQDFLAQLCLDRDHSKKARTYLEELGLHDAVPEEADDPDFRASAEVCHWLADAQQFGRAPDVLELFDTRELHWPPNEDWRPVWLFHYRYRAKSPDQPDQTGVVMTGGITGSLPAGTSDQMLADEVYALHCCWELEAKGDPRAPAEQTIAAGRALLDAAPQEPPDPFDDF